MEIVFGVSSSQWRLHSFTGGALNVCTKYNTHLFNIFAAFKEFSSKWWADWPASTATTLSFILFNPTEQYGYLILHRIALAFSWCKPHFCFMNGLTCHMYIWFNFNMAALSSLLVLLSFPVFYQGPVHFASLPCCPFHPFFSLSLLHPLSSVPFSQATLLSRLFPSFGTSWTWRVHKNCISTQFPTGTLQYLIKSAFVWRELWICVWVSDKERCLASVCVDTVCLCKRGAERRSDSFGMKGFLWSYDNWFTISLSLDGPSCSSRSIFSISPPFLNFPSPYNLFFSLHLIV